MISSLISSSLLPLVPVPGCLSYILDISTWLCHSCLKTKMSETVHKSPFQTNSPLISVTTIRPVTCAHNLKLFLPFFSLSSSYTDNSFKISSVSVTTQI